MAAAHNRNGVAWHQHQAAKTIGGGENNGVAALAAIEQQDRSENINESESSDENIMASA
jgi:hypothetical protein